MLIAGAAYARLAKLAAKSSGNDWVERHLNDMMREFVDDDQAQTWIQIGIQLQILVQGSIGVLIAI